MRLYWLPRGNSRLTEMSFAAYSAARASAFSGLVLAAHQYTVNTLEYLLRAVLGPVDCPIILAVLYVQRTPPQGYRITYCRVSHYLL